MDNSFTTAEDTLDFIAFNGINDNDVDGQPEIDNGDNEDVEKIERIFRESIQFI